MKNVPCIFSKFFGAMALVIGALILYENVAMTAAQLRDLGFIPGDSSSSLSIILATARVLQSYAADHHAFVESLGRKVLMLSWPLLLITAGTLLSTDCVQPRHFYRQESDKDVDSCIRHSTPR